MNDCDADAENTVGRSSSINFSVRSLYKLYTLAIQDICNEENKSKYWIPENLGKVRGNSQQVFLLIVQLNLINFLFILWNWKSLSLPFNLDFNHSVGKLFPLRVLHRNDSMFIHSLPLLDNKLIMISLTLRRPLTKCCWVSLRNSPIVVENKFLLSSLTDGYCLANATL